MAMRITNGMMTSQFLNNLNRNLNRVSDTYEQVTTGQRINDIDDDPLATVATLKAKSRSATLELYQNNITTATDNLEEIEDTADSMDELVQSAYEDMVGAASDSKTQDDWDTIAEELQQMLEDVVSMGNSSTGSTYLFSGYSTSEAPFTVSSSGDLMYNGINLTDLGAYDDYMELLGNTESDDGSDSELTTLAKTISDLYTQLTDSSTSDYEAQNTICASLYSALEDFIDSGNDALSALQEFSNLSESSDSYQNLSGLLDTLSTLKDTIYNEMSQDAYDGNDTIYVIGDSDTDTSGYGDNVTLVDSADVQYTDDGEIDTDYYDELGITVLTADEYENYFHTSSITSALSSISFSITDSGTTTTSTGISALESTVSSLQSAIETDQSSAFETVRSDADALEEEEDDQVKLQIGDDQTVAITYSGTSLLGSGNENLYYVLSKCITALQNGDSDEFTELASQLQDCQSNVLTFETKVGTRISSLDSLTARYSSSEDNYEEMRSDAEDVDEAEAVTNWETAQTVYEAALTAGATILNVSLLDFLD